jgi:uroporphyrinogen III methyltransferase/synthase
VPAYETKPASAERAAELARDLDRGAIDVVTFTSSSTVTSTCDALGAGAPELLGRAVVGSIGPITTETCASRGIRVDVTAPEHTVPGLVQALETYLAEAPSGRVSPIDKPAP